MLQKKNIGMTIRTMLITMLWQDSLLPIITHTVKSDGNILVAGSMNNSIGIARFSKAGKVDTTFGLKNTKYKNDQPQVVAFDPKNNLLVADSKYNDATHKADLTITRYKEDGSIDAAFGIKGVSTTPWDTEHAQIKALEFYPDGRFVLATDDTLVQYDAQGKLDTKFGKNGKLQPVDSTNNPIRINDMVIDASNNILVASNNSDLLRYNAQGVKDGSFKPSPSSGIISMFIDKNGSIIGATATQGSSSSSSSSSGTNTKLSFVKIDPKGKSSQLFTANISDDNMINSIEPLKGSDNKDYIFVAVSVYDAQYKPILSGIILDGTNGTEIKRIDLGGVADAFSSITGSTALISLQPNRKSPTDPEVFILGKLSFDPTSAEKISPETTFGKNGNAGISSKGDDLTTLVSQAETSAQLVDSLDDLAAKLDDLAGALKVSAPASSFVPEGYRQLPNGELQKIN